MSRLTTQTSITKEDAEERYGKPLSDEEFEQIKVMYESFPEKKNVYLENLMGKSPPVRKQFELDLKGMIEEGGVEEEKPWFPIVDTGIRGVEQMYSRTVLIEPLPPASSCAAHCVFCIRKGYDEVMTDEDIEKSAEYIQEHPEVKDVLITGGDPFIAHKRLEKVLQRLDEVEPKEEGHLSHIRIATRAPSYDPDRVTDELVDMVKEHEIYDLQTRYQRFVDIATHFNHPDEFTPEAEEALKRFRDRGLMIYIQTVLLKRINDNPQTLRELGEKIRKNGCLWHYLYHNDNAKGTSYLRTSVERGLELMDDLGDSGFVTPDFVVLTKVGKARMKGNTRILNSFTENRIPYVDIRTNYRMGDIQELNPNFSLPPGYRTNSEGYIIARYVDGRD